MLLKEHVGKTRDQIIDHLMSQNGGYWPLALIFDYLDENKLNFILENN